MFPIGGFGFFGGPILYGYNIVSNYVQNLAAGVQSFFLGGGGQPTTSTEVNGIFYQQYRRYLARKSNGSKKEPLPQGTDSKNYAERGRSYIRERIGLGGSLPSQAKVLKSVLGNDGMKSEAARKDEREKDDVLRRITERAMAWITDASARGEFVRKWGEAKDDVDRIRVLLDPQGRGSKVLSQILPETAARDILKDNDENGNWERALVWVENNLGSDVISEMGSELLPLVRARGVAGQTLIDDKKRREYINALREKGYTEHEAEAIVDALGATEVGDVAMGALKDLRGRAPEYRDLEAMVKDELPRLQQRLEERKKELQEARDKKPKKGMEHIRDQKIEGLEREVERLGDEIQQLLQKVRRGLRNRAEIFLQDYSHVVQECYKRDLPKLPDDVISVPGTVAWVQTWLRDQGRQVPMPAVTEDSLEAALKAVSTSATTAPVTPTAPTARPARRRGAGRGGRAAATPASAPAQAPLAESDVTKFSKHEERHPRLRNRVQAIIQNQTKIGEYDIEFGYAPSDRYRVRVKVEEVTQTGKPPELERSLIKLEYFNPVANSWVEIQIR